MTTNHSTGESATFAQDQAARTCDPMYEDLLLGINGLITAVQVSGADTAIKARRPELWQAACRLIGDDTSRAAVDQQVRATGFVSALQAIAETPGTLERMLTSFAGRVERTPQPRGRPARAGGHHAAHGAHVHRGPPAAGGRCHALTRRQGGHELGRWDRHRGDQQWGSTICCLSRRGCCGWPAGGCSKTRRTPWRVASGSS